MMSTIYKYAVRTITNNSGIILNNSGKKTKQPNWIDEVQMRKKRKEAAFRLERIFSSLQ